MGVIASSSIEIETHIGNTVSNLQRLGHIRRLVNWQNVSDLAGLWTSQLIYVSNFRIQEVFVDGTPVPLGHVKRNYPLFTLYYPPKMLNRGKIYLGMRAVIVGHQYLMSGKMFLCLGIVKSIIVFNLSFFQSFVCIVKCTTIFGLKFKIFNLIPFWGFFSFVHNFSNLNSVQRLWIFSNKLGLGYLHGLCILNFLHGILNSLQLMWW